MANDDYMRETCSKCGKYKAIALDSYGTKQGNFIVKYVCEICKHKGKKSSRIRINAKNRIA